MSTIAIVLLVIFIAGAAIGIYALRAPRRERARIEETGRGPLQAQTDWAGEAGDTFSGLSEAARCDLVFAVAALDDERSNQLLEHALDDPAEAVATAAAHALASSGRSAVLQAYLAGHPGERAERIAQVLALLDPKEAAWQPPR